MRVYGWPLALCLSVALGLWLALAFDGVADVLGVGLTAAPLVALLLLARRARSAA